VLVRCSTQRLDTTRRSWLQDTLKRKLVDFAWNRRFFYLPGACSPFFRVNSASSFNQPDFFIRSACLIHRRVNLGLTRRNRKGGGAKKIEKNGEFSFRGILQPTTQVSTPRGNDLHKTFVYVKAFVHERIVPFSSLPICIAHATARPLHEFCTSYDPRPAPLLYAVHHTQLVFAI